MAKVYQHAAAKRDLVGTEWAIGTRPQQEQDHQKSPKGDIVNI